MLSQFIARLYLRAFSFHHSFQVEKECPLIAVFSSNEVIIYAIDMHLFCSPEKNVLSSLPVWCDTCSSFCSFYGSHRIIGSSRFIRILINLLVATNSKCFRHREKTIPQSSTFAGETFLLRRGSEATRYKLTALIMFIAGFGLLTLGTWLLNDFIFLNFTN